MFILTALYLTGRGHESSGGMTDGTQRFEPQGSSGNKVTKLLEVYCRAYDTLHDAPDLSPKNAEAQKDISALIAAVRRPYVPEEIEQILTHPDVKSLRYGMWGLIAKAERDTELYWNTRLEQSHLKDFRLFKNFDRQIDAELAMLGHPTTRISMKGYESILFVGAGSLPVDAILMYEKTGMPVTCIDSNRTIAKLGRNFIERCGYSDHVTYRYAFGEDYDYAHHPIVFIENTVQNKVGILDNINECISVEQLAVRSAQGIYSLLYEPFSAQLAQIFKLKFQDYAIGTPETLQTTLLARLHLPPTHEVIPPQDYSKEDLYHLRIPMGERHRKMLTPDS